MVAILSPDAVSKVRMTADEYFQAELPEGYRYELVEGVVEISPPPGTQHDDGLERLAELLFDYRKAHPGSIAKIGLKAGVVIPGKETVREPDLCVYRHWPKNARGFEVWKERTPLVVIEAVSVGQARRDSEDKREDYLQAGVEEYWILDPHKECVRVLAREGSQWRETVFTEADTYRPAALPEFELPVRLVLKDK
ncbi:MAG: Uma2 family endonuclease [Phycisphaerae bacterium]